MPSSGHPPKALFGGWLTAKSYMRPDVSSIRPPEVWSVAKRGSDVHCRLVRSNRDRSPVIPRRGFSGQWLLDEGGNPGRTRRNSRGNCRIESSPWRIECNHELSRRKSRWTDEAILRTGDWGSKSPLTRAEGPVTIA